jgi:hypothetical protein
MPASRKSDTTLFFVQGKIREEELFFKNPSLSNNFKG